jgi:hypothetical protein
MLAQPTREYASAPPARTTSASPVRIRSAARPTAKPPAAQALLTLTLTPARPSSAPTAAATP